MSEKIVWPKSGVYVGSKNIPSAVQIEQKDVGGAGYWKFIHVIVEDDAIKFDEGRKTITRGAQPSRIADKIAAKVFKDLSHYIMTFTGQEQIEDTPKLVTQKQKNIRFEQYKTVGALEISAEPVGSPEIRFATTPRGDQEAAVQSLFNQLIAAGYLPFYYVAEEGYGKTYDCDLFYRIGTNDEVFTDLPEQRQAEYKSIANDGQVEFSVTAEYKKKAFDLVKDVRNGGPKSIEHVDLLICWDIIHDRNHKKWEEKVEAISVSENPAKEDFYGVTHKIKWFNISSEMPVISLDHLVKWFNDQQPIEGSENEVIVDDTGQENSDNAQLEENSEDLEHSWERLDFPGFDEQE
mgnify:CR=1 FL=1